MKNILNKIVNFIKNNKLLFITFFVSTVVISIIYSLNSVTPFGKKSLLCVDFFHQYGPMLAELYDRILSGENLTYSFNMAMGLPFFRNFLNYLSSPFNIIMFFFSRKNLITSYSFIIGFKAVMSSCTMVYYLSKKFNNKNLYMIPMGIMYAFSAYFSAYYWNIMWLDGMVFLPLITLGIENIINNGKWKMYSIMLTIMLIANYFIGYMICIFAVVYFIIYLFYKTEYKKKKIKEAFKFMLKKSIKFALASLISGLIGAGLLIPMFISMKSISATGGSIPTSQYYSFKVIDYINSHFTGTSTTVFASDEITNPNISCGILSVGLILLYILNVDIPLKNKIAYLLLLGFMIFAFFNPFLDYVLHAFHVPNDLPYRYSFIYSFILTIICTYSIVNIKKLSFPIIAVTYIFILAFLLQLSDSNWSGITKNMVYINMILVTLYFIFYAAIHFIDYMHIVFYLSLIFIVSVDAIVSINYNWDITQELKNFYSDYEETEELLNYAASYDDELFYRIENTSMLTLNDASWYDYYGMTSFSSMAYEDMAILQHNLGLPGNEINSYYYAQTTPVNDMMFDIKYFIGTSNDTNRYSELKSNSETLNEFNFNVGLGYGVKKDIKNWNFINLNPFENQNDYISKASGIENVLASSSLVNKTELYSDDNEIIEMYEYENTFDNFYFYSSDSSIDYIKIGESIYYINDNYTNYTNLTDDLVYSYVEKYDEKKIININSTEDTIKVTIAHPKYSSPSFFVHHIDHEAFSEAYQYFKKHKFNITNFKEYLIEGNINLGSQMMVYTSIPYDDGWECYVDGEKVETYKIGDILLGFDCPQGIHKIKIRYRVPYMLLGNIISILTIISIIIYTKYNKFIKKTLKKALIKKRTIKAK